MNLESMTDRAVLAELGRRIHSRRLNANRAQAEIAQRAGISRRALQNLESGRACTLSLWIRVLRALGQLGQLDALLPEPGPSPIQLAKLKGRVRRRASSRRRRTIPAEI